MTKRQPPKKISLFVSDVDGTIVTPSPNKGLAPATIAAVGRLKEAGIAFSIVSSRPPRGMLSVAGPLGLDRFAGFNGSEIVSGDLTPIEQHFVPEDAARIAVAEMQKAGADVWVFADNEWFVTDPDDPYIAHEVNTVGFTPTVVKHFGDHLARAGKIVGSSSNPELLARAEAELQKMLGTAASAKRSQTYYLDVTHPTADKGHAVRALARHFGVPLKEVAVIGDMINDLPMFPVGALAIAMGNASDFVKSQADFVTSSNAEDGVAHAIDTLILPRAP